MVFFKHKSMLINCIDLIFTTSSIFLKKSKARQEFGRPFFTVQRWKQYNLWFSSWQTHKNSSQTRKQNKTKPNKNPHTIFFVCFIFATGVFILCIFKMMVVCFYYLSYIYKLSNVKFLIVTWVVFINKHVFYYLSTTLLKAL